MNFATRISQLLISAIFACAVGQSPAELAAAEAPSLRVVYNALGGSMAPVWVAQELGLFAKHGLQHSLNYLAATTAVQALAAGSEEIGLVGNQGVDMALEGVNTRPGSLDDTLQIRHRCRLALHHQVNHVKGFTNKLGSVHLL